MGVYLVPDRIRLDIVDGNRGLGHPEDYTVMVKMVILINTKSYN